MVAEVSDEHDRSGGRWARSLELLGVGAAETVRKWVRQAQVDAGSALGSRRGVRRAEAIEAGERRTEKGQRDFEDSVSFLRGRTRPASTLITRFIACASTGLVD